MFRKLILQMSSFYFFKRNYVFFILFIEFNVNRNGDCACCLVKCEALSCEFLYWGFLLLRWFYSTHLKSLGILNLIDNSTKNVKYFENFSIFTLFLCLVQSGSHNMKSQGQLTIIWHKRINLKHQTISISQQSYYFTRWL